MKAILVSVDYADILNVTLPYNRHHFDEVMVVTTTDDVETRLVALRNVCKVHMTEAFYADGAVFNKWRALEEGLAKFNLDDEWLCIMDADVLWPLYASFRLQRGNLYTPLRRMMRDVTQAIPEEKHWQQYPLHPQQREFAGYTQIFHTSDPVLGPLPWHQTDWAHAGGADSFFQDKWPQSKKVRPGFEVLHLGESGVNWCGRASAFIDGRVPMDASDKKKTLRNYIKSRKQGPDRFAGEKIQVSQQSGS